MVTDFSQSAEEEVAGLSESFSQIKGEGTVTKEWYIRGLLSHCPLQRHLDISLKSSKIAVWARGW